MRMFRFLGKGLAFLILLGALAAGAFHFWVRFSDPVKEAIQRFFERTPNAKGPAVGEV